MKTTTCYRCHQPVWFATTPAGKTVSVNTWTSPKGKVVPLDPEADRPLVRFLKNDEEPDTQQRYVLHMTTCRGKRR